MMALPTSTSNSAGSSTIPHWLGLLASTLVIVTADHGEHLGEHQLYGHASSLYDAEIHVPLLILLPGEKPHAGQVVTVQVSLGHLAATVAHVTGLGGSPFPGRSLARHWAADASPLSEPSLSEVDAPVMTGPNQGRSPVFRGPMKAVAAGNSARRPYAAMSETFFQSPES